MRTTRRAFLVGGAAVAATAFLPAGRVAAAAERLPDIVTKLPFVRQGGAWFLPPGTYRLDGPAIFDRPGIFLMKETEIKIALGTDEVMIFFTGRNISVDGGTFTAVHRLPGLGSPSSSEHRDEGDVVPLDPIADGPGRGLDL